MVHSWRISLIACVCVCFWFATHLCSTDPPSLLFTGMVWIHCCRVQVTLWVKSWVTFKKTIFLNFLSFFLIPISFLFLARYSRFLLPLFPFQASYASSDLYSYNGLSSSRNPGSAFNDYQVCIQTNTRHTHCEHSQEKTLSFVATLLLLRDLPPLCGEGQEKIDSVQEQVKISQPVPTFCLVNLILTPDFILCCSSAGHSVRSPSSSIVGLVPFISSLPFTHYNFHMVLNDFNYHSLTPAYSYFS